MILIVDDESENRSTLRAVLEREGWKCLEAEGGTQALEFLRSHAEIQLLITDLKMPGLNGLELLTSARLIRPDVQRILVTAFGTIEDTVSAMKAGAFDVLTKPLKSKAIKECVRRLLDRAPKNLSIGAKASQISPAYAAVMDTLRRAASSQANVLLLGESGTGKSYLAKILHGASERRDGPYVALNCATIPQDLLESELFGHEKGAFTGAYQTRDGKIRAADGGSLLLDEIGDLSPALQAKLLQFIQERKFFRLGSNREVSADVRILSATHRPLETLVNTGGFREDLLYRLKVVEILVPPLRDRKMDLLWLIPTLLDRLAEKNKRPTMRLSQNALTALWAYNWPGNVRELENVLESALVLAPAEELRDGLLTELSLPGRFRKLLNTNSGSSELDVAPVVSDLATIERQAIAQTLALTGGNRRMTAHLLGISERTLYRVLGS